jgi:folate-dependent phosphoribosylglycinamide formyltransferase PurN
VKLIPVELVQEYPKSILNIHPSLLPAFGGKGYYGLKVHKAVIASGARYFTISLSPITSNCCAVCISTQCYFHGKQYLGS